MRLFALTPYSSCLDYDFFPGAAAGEHPVDRE